MLTVETVLKVRLAGKRDGKSVRGIARKYQLSRNNVRRYLRSGEVEPRHQRRQEVKPKLGPFLADLEQLLAEDLKRPTRERRSALMLFEELQRRGYQGAYDSVRGKSRTGKAIVYVSYRGIHVVSLREAYILRFASDLGGTIFFDIRSLWQKAVREGSDDILLCRFERGLRVPRVNNPDRGPHRDTVYYSVFGPTVISTNDPIHHILDTRAVTIVMPETTRRFEADVTPEAAQPLRERLVAFRARHLNQPLPEASKPAAGRLGDILRPLRQIVRLARPDRESAFLAFVNSLQRERLKNRAETLEAELLRILDSLRDQVSDGLLPVRLVAEALNDGRLDKDKVSHQKVGVKLRSLGFEKGGRDRDGMLIRWDEDVLARTMEAYGLRDSTQSAHSTQTAATTAGDDWADAECVECEELEQGAGGHGAHIPSVIPDAAPQPDEPTPGPHRPCYACGDTPLWLDTLGTWHCGTCHPAAAPDIVAQWLNVEADEGRP